MYASFDIFAKRRGRVLPLGAPHARFGTALLLSLLLHAALFAAAQWLGDAADSRRPAPRPLAVVLPPALPQAQPQSQPPLLLPEPARRAPAARPARQAPPARPDSRRASASLPAAEQLVRNLLYPPEAIAQGLQGEALVLLFLDESGSAIAARLEQSSGHAILDEAALRAARTVSTVPDGTPREMLLPVRFRLQ